MSEPAQPLPTVFISHGAPTLALEVSPEQRFLAGFAKRLGKPSAILVISAHWDSAEVRVLGGKAPSTVHDFYGFPRALYELQYPAPGADSLAGEVVDLLNEAGFNAALDPERGFDHGVWSPLLLMYPHAEVPVTQVSINAHRSPDYHWRLGRVLCSLRARRVLVVGSGAMTHNLADCRLHDATDSAVRLPYVTAFADWIAEQLASGQLESLLGYRDRAPAATRAHPTDEHLLPLFTALGAAGEPWAAERVHCSVMHQGLAMDHYLFSAPSGPSCQPAFS